MMRGVLLRIVMLPATALACTLALVGTALSSLVPAWRDAAIHVGRVWGRAMLTVAGARVRYCGLEHLAADEPRIYVANHQSHIDVWALLAAVPPTTRFVAKAELFELPLFGHALRATGFVRVDRGDRSSAIASLDRAAAAIRAGRSMLLYPEGTRSRDGRLQPFKKGAFHLALAARVPLVPIAVRGAFEVMPAGSWRVTPGPVEVRFLAPIDVAAHEGDHAALRERVHAIVAAELDRPAPADARDQSPGARSAARNIG